jgi:ABC-type iron transport system FetAB ATPase subunit
LDGLKIENLCFQTLGPISLTVARSECVGMTGPSGAGKSLFLKAVADMIPCTGKISLDGTESAQMSGPQWRKKAGLLPAESSWWFDTVRPHFKTVDENRLESVGFYKDVLEWEVSRLSSGERQRLALIRLLANKPDVLLLDEPTANLDAENIIRVEKLLQTYRLENKTAVIWVSHDTEQLKRVSTRSFLIIDNGKLMIQQQTTGN